MIGYRCIWWFSAINRGPPTLHQSANMILLFFSLGSCPSKKCQKVAYMHTVALTDSASRNLFLKSFENFKGLFYNEIQLVFQIWSQIWQGVPKYVFFEGEHVDIPI